MQKPEERVCSYGINFTVLLIHGSAPFNEDGNVPDPRAGKYQKTDFFRDLANLLETRGWMVVRYSKPGVSKDKINFEEYKNTDLFSIKAQLLKLWTLLPKNKPRLVFAWSEGSLHIHLLPVHEIDGVVILGGVSTNIKSVILSQAKDKTEKSQIEEELNKLSLVPRDTMIGLDRPAGRLVDEFNLKDNWTYFSGFPELPILILHGEKDNEVPLNEAYVWAKQFPSNRIQTHIRPGGNHMYGLDNTNGAELITEEIFNWWKTNTKIAVQ